MPHKEKLKVQEKIDLIRRCQTGELGKTEASRIAGVDLKTIYHWLARYEAEGESGFMAYSRNRVYTPEAKLNAVRDYLSGKGSQLEICKKYKIRNTHCLRGWIKVYNAHGDFSSRKYSGGGSYMKQGRTTTQEERVQIAKECIASGKNYGEIAQKYQMSYQQAGLHFDLRLAFPQFRVIGVDPRPVVIKEKNLCHCCAPLLNHGQLHPAVKLGLVIETVVVAGTVFPVDNEDVALGGFPDFVFHGCYLRFDFGLFPFPYLD